MVNNILKCGTGNLIILYHYMYSRLLDIIENVIWNFIRLMKSVRSSLWVDR